MEKKINQSKKENASKNQIDASKKNAIQKINLSSIASKLEGINPSEKRERESIYLYPKEFSKEMISGDKGKSFRNSMRKKRDSLCNNILFFAKGKKDAELKESIAKFNSFYKENYQRNDYAIASLSQKNDDAGNQFIILALEIIKLSKGSK